MVQIDAKVMVGWLVFLWIYILVWRASTDNAMRMAFTVTSHAKPERPLQRAYLFLFGAYVACRAALLVSLYMLLLFCVMSCVQCVLPFLRHKKCFHAAMTWLFSEDVAFRALQPRLLPFHAAVLLSCLWIATVYSVAYATDADLLDAGRSQSVVKREVLCMPVIGVCAYLGMALSVFTIKQS